MRSTPSRTARIGTFAAAALAVTFVVTVSSEDSASASELAPFGSCEELASWAREAAAAPVGAPRGGPDVASAVMDAAELSAAAQPADSTTNVVVEGVDEIDLVDRLDDRHLLVVASGTLNVVDVLDGEVTTSLPAPYDAQVSFDEDHDVVWSVGSTDDGRTTVQRFAREGATLRVDGEWRSDGRVVTARRTGEGLHVVLVQDWPLMGDGSSALPPIPFEDGPVSCDQVLHPAGLSSSSATLLANLPAVGELVPTAATEVVGAGRLAHVTTDALYLATPLWEEGATSLHRFDLRTLAHTGSGRTDGALLNEFAMSEHEGTLRVAVTVGAARGGAVEDELVAEQPPIDLPAPPSSDAAVNRVVVFDTDGELDELGRTRPFGHPGETLHGVRFAGATAYAVTFLTTDPFYVIDLSNSAAPAVVGEVELPGFSSYLHPLRDGRVVGFGPDGEGYYAAKLFDVSDPTNPHVLDTALLGADAPVAWDHHAFVSLADGRFAVPGATWRPLDTPGCDESRRAALHARADVLDEQIGALYEASGAPGGSPDQTVARALDGERARVLRNPCLAPPVVADSTAWTFDTSDGDLHVAAQVTVTAELPALRALPVGDAWAFLTPSQLVVTDSDGVVVHDITLVALDSAQPTAVEGDGSASSKPSPAG